MMLAKSAAAALVAILLSNVPSRCGAKCFQNRDELVRAIKVLKYIPEANLFYNPYVWLFYGLVQDWCFAPALKDMSYLGFHHKFNVNISAWDVSHVENMRGMFKDAVAFNQPITDWDVARVTSMKEMFRNAAHFNKPIWKWDVSKVETMEAMFWDAKRFNGHIGFWNVSRVTTLKSMFRNAGAYNRPMFLWDVSRVKKMNWMFSEASSFNYEINDWDVSKLKTMERMFEHATSFDQPLNLWNVLKVETMHRAFFGSGINQDLCDWGERMGKVNNIQAMFLSSNCRQTGNPDLNADPISPLCHACE